MKLGIIGGGAWGTALGIALNSKFDQVAIYAIENSVVNSINNDHKNNLYLTNKLLPSNIQATSNLDDMQESDIILITTPTQYIRTTLQNLKKVKANTLFLICSKGIEISSGKLISQVISTDLNIKNKVGILTGPTFSIDLANNLPTLFTLAMPTLEQAKDIGDKIKTPHIRIYYSNDIIGVQVGGAMKNIVAIAGGIIAGAELGHNALSGMLTRSLGEMITLCKTWGGNPHTIYGLSGLGDLILTATSEKSRNFSLGYEIGKQGFYNEEIATKLHGVTEGFYTAKAISNLIQSLKLEMPICNEVYKICYESKRVLESLEDLMERPQQTEF